ncbi:MAG: PHP domain-containing protein [Microthrixaceae bacterium]
MTTTGSVDTATAALRRAIYYLDRSLAPAPKVRAFRTALSVVEGLGDDELDRHLAARSITELDGIGPSTGAVITEAFGDGSKPGYLSKLEASTRLEVGEGAELRTRLRGDCHLHSTWSDGGASIEDMARTAIDLGHEYIVLTDHSPRLTIAHGLSQERLDEQHVEVERLNELLSPFRILRGVEVDILEDGTLDHSDEVLAGLDIVVASVHSKLKMPAEQMTRRMVMAVANPNVDILGHCTGRQIVGTPRAPSSSTPRSSSRPAPGSAPPSRSTAARNARIRPTNCSSSRSTGTAWCPSTPTPMPPARWNGRSPAATRRSATGSTTPRS